MRNEKALLLFFNNLGSKNYEKWGLLESNLLKTHRQNKCDFWQIPFKTILRGHFSRFTFQATLV